MFNVICVFFPSLISICIEKYFLKEKYSIDTIINYAIYCLINNFIIVGIFTFLYNNNYDIWASINLYPRMTLKYGIFAIITATLLAFIKIIIKKNVGFEIEVKNK